MSEITLSDYFYGDEAAQFSHFRIPRQLIDQTDFIHTNQSIYPPAPSAKQTEMDRCEFRENAAVQNGFKKICLTVKRIFVAIQAELTFMRFPSGQRRRKAVLSEQVCHLLNTNDRLLGGKAPLKPLINEIRLTVRRISGKGESHAET